MREPHLLPVGFCRVVAGAVVDCQATLDAHAFQHGPHPRHATVAELMLILAADNLPDATDASRDKRNPPLVELDDGIRQVVGQARHDRERVGL